MGAKRVDTVDYDTLDLGKMEKRNMALEVMQIREDEHAIIFRITTPDKDLRGDIVDTKGIDIGYYEKHPVFLWAHDHSIPSLGRAMWIKKKAKEILIKVQFQDVQEFARDVYRLYKLDFLNGCSIGFLPTNDEPVDEENPYGGTRYVESILIEVSGCNCPAHPDAMAVAKSLVTTKRLRRDLGLDDEVKNGVGGKRGLSLAPEDRSWDATRARKSMRVWASSDGSGEKDKMNWAKYRQGHTWYDPDDVENFGAYKLPFAEVLDGTLKAVWRGVAAAMGNLLGARQKPDIPESDRKLVYSFLVSYYKKFDKDPPEFKSYTKEEWDVLLAGWDIDPKEYYDEPEKEPQEADKEKEKQLLVKVLKGIKDFIQVVDARFKKLEAKALSEKSTPAKVQAEVIDIVDDETPGKKSPGESKPKVVDEGLTHKEAEELVSKVLPKAIDGALAYYQGETFIPKK